MPNRNDAMTLVAGHLDRNAFEPEPDRPVTMRFACPTFARMAGVYRDLGDPDDEEGTP